METPLSLAEQYTGEDMDAPMTLAVALNLGGTWPEAHVDTARRAIRREHLRREALPDRSDWEPQTFSV